MHELNDISAKVDALTTQVKEVKDAILGNAFTKGKGIIEIQQEHDERISALERIKDKAIWMAVGAGITGGMAISKIISMVTAAFAK